MRRLLLNDVDVRPNKPIFAEPSNPKSPAGEFGDSLLEQASGIAGPARAKSSHEGRSVQIFLLTKLLSH